MCTFGGQSANLHVTIAALLTEALAAGVGTQVWYQLYAACIVPTDYHFCFVVVGRVPSPTSTLVWSTSFLAAPIAEG